MCHRVVSEDAFMIIYCRDKYEIQRMYDGAVDDCLAVLKFITDWYVTSKILKNFDNALHANVDYFTFLMNILIKSHLLLIKDLL